MLPAQRTFVKVLLKLGSIQMETALTVVPRKSRAPPAKRSLTLEDPVQKNPSTLKMMYKVIIVLTLGGVISRIDEFFAKVCFNNMIE